MSTNGLVHDVPKLDDGLSDPILVKDGFQLGCEPFYSTYSTVYVRIAFV